MSAALETCRKRFEIEPYKFDFKHSDFRKSQKDTIMFEYFGNRCDISKIMLFSLLFVDERRRTFGRSFSLYEKH